MNVTENPLRRRMGKFYLSAKFVDDTPEIAIRLMADFLVFRCEFIWYREAFLYHAISRHFEYLPRGAEAPEYRVTIENGEVQAEILEAQQ